MNMYTIRSTSDEGIYYLCNHWNKNKTFWISEHDIRNDRLFKTRGLAERSLKHLLEIMEDYKTDIFQPVKITESGDIVEL